MEKLRQQVRKVLYSEGVTPLPVRTLIILFLVNFLMSMTTTMCFSYLPKMIKTFGVSEVETGRSAGYIASSVYVGWILCGYGTGCLADAKGHKLVLIICMSVMITATLMFGLSSSFYWAVCFRFMQGLCLGTLAICKAILTLECDDTNMTLAFSIFFTSWTTAFIVGPSLAGYLVFPAEQYPNIFSADSLFGKFGVLLPNLVTASCLTLILILVVIYLPKDKHKTPERYPTGEKKTLLADDHSSKTRDYLSTSINAGLKEEHRQLQINKRSKGGSNYTCGIREPEDFIAINNSSNKDLTSVESGGLLRSFIIFKKKEFCINVLLYALSAFAITGVEEIFAVFAATSGTYNGLELTTSEIGTILLSSSALLLVVQVTITGRISHRYGARKTFIGCTMFLMLTVPLIPTLYLVHGKAQLYAFAIVIMTMNQVLINAVIVNINVLINNSVTPEVYGAANGIAMTGSSIGRSFAPTVIGSLFSWSLTNIEKKEGLGFPFNHYFTFFVAGLVFLLCACIALIFLSPKVKEPQQQVKSGTDGEL